MNKHYKGYLIGLSIFMLSIWAGAFAIDSLPKGHWAIFPTFATMALGMWLSVVITIMGEYND